MLLSIFAAILLSIIQLCKSVRAAHKQGREAANAKEEESTQEQEDEDHHHRGFQSRSDYQSLCPAGTRAQPSDASFISHSRRPENGERHEQARQKNWERVRPNTNTKDIIFQGTIFRGVPMQMHSNESIHRNRKYIRVDYIERLPDRGGKEVRKHKKFGVRELGTADEAVGAARDWIRENLTASGHLKSEVEVS